jgi:Aspartyl protease
MAFQWAQVPTLTYFFSGVAPDPAVTTFRRAFMTGSRTGIALLVLSLGGSLLSAEPTVRPIATVEGKRDGKLIFVPLQVNGKGPYWFCVDTGASHTVLDPVLGNELHMKIIESSATTGTGQGDVPVNHVGPITIRSGSLEFHVPDPWVIDLSQVPIPNWTRGLMGAEFFESYVVELNPERPSLRFYDSATYRKRPNATSIPLTLENHKLFITAKIEVTDQKVVDRQLRIDTGSEDSIADSIVKEGREVRETVLGKGLGKDFKGYSGLVKAVQVGPFRFTDVWGPGSPRSAVGMEILRRFTTVFDGPHRAIYLEANEHLADSVPAPSP